MMPELLHDAVVALHQGDWRTALLALRRDGVSGPPEVVDAGICLRCVTRCIQIQSARADVEAASYQIDTALRVLGRHPLALRGVEPPPARWPDHLLWIAGRLVQRERADLDAVRRLFEELPRGRAELVHACVEHLTMIEFDPWSVALHPMDRELTGLSGDEYARWRTGNRRDLCARASRLRQFADVRSGSVTERTWQRVGGYPALREQALRTLAAEPETRGRADLPVRLGRRRAWAYARQWLRDTDT